MDEKVLVAFEDGTVKEESSALLVTRRLFRRLL